MSRIDSPIAEVTTRAYTFPTSCPEADGTLSWDSTTAVTVRVQAGGHYGLGWTYSSPAAAAVIDAHLTEVVTGRDAYDVPGCWEAMVRACRNLGRPGIVSQAIAAVDIALWDLKATLLDLPLHWLFGQVRDTVPVYGSGGFTSMTDDELSEQVEGWLAAGCRGVKIKVGQSWGSEPVRDLHRIAFVKNLIPDGVAMMVDANGGYQPAQARRLGAAFDALGVTWLEEPVSSDDLDGLSQLRGALRCDIAAGEYADSVQYVRRMCEADAVDCLQLDVTRCAGYTEWLRCAAVAAAHGLQVSAHCAPSLHAAVAACVPNLRHVEWFADHARLEPILVCNGPQVCEGELHFNDAPGHGMTIRSDANRYAS